MPQKFHKKKGLSETLENKDCVKKSDQKSLELKNPKNSKVKFMVYYGIIGVAI